MRRIVLCSLLSALCSAANAQGFLPPTSTSTVVSTDVARPLQIAEKVPETLTVTDTSGKKRALLSYKSPTEVLVVTFFSARCGAEQAQWPDFRRLHERYKDWKVAFLAINTSAPNMLPELANTLKKEKLPWPVLQDDQRAAAYLFKITGTPEVVVMDEYGILKYRGPVSRIKPALDTVIGHMDIVKDPEPPFEPACPLP